MLTYIVLGGLGIFVVGSLVTLITIEFRKNENDNS